MIEPLVYLADLRHSYSGVLSSDCMPLGISYIKAVIDRDIPRVQSRLFAYPSDLGDAVRSRPPDVLMLSNYFWNVELSLFFARFLKNLKPDGLVVMGGPNIPIEESRRKEFISSHPEVDLYILGEGDFVGPEVIKHYLDSGKSLVKMMQRTIVSSIYRTVDGQIVHQPQIPMLRHLDDIPSPWLKGIQDGFFDGKLAPMIETNRGCPFTCTFCIQGTSYYQKVHYFSMDRIREE